MVGRLGVAGLLASLRHICMIISSYAGLKDEVYAFRNKRHALPSLICHIDDPIDALQMCLQEHLAACIMTFMTTCTYCCVAASASGCTRRTRHSTCTRTAASPRSTPTAALSMPTRQAGPRNCALRHVGPSASW